MYDTLFKKLERSQKSGTYKVTGKVAPERKQTVQMKALYAVHNWEDMDSLENRTGLPKRLKSGIENLSGLSMDDVRVHYNSSRPAQFYALAYTQEQIFMLRQDRRSILPMRRGMLYNKKKGAFIRPCRLKVSL